MEPINQASTTELLYNLGRSAPGGMFDILEALRRCPDVIPKALENLARGDEMMRQMMLVALRFGTTPEHWTVAPWAWEAVRVALRDHSPRARGLAVELLASPAAAAWVDLAVALDDRDRDVKRRAASALLRLNRTAAARLLGSRLLSSDEEDRVAILAAALQERASELGTAASVALRDPSPRVRKAAAELLGLSVDNLASSAREDLATALHDVSEEVRFTAAVGLANSADVSPIEVFLGALKDSSSSVRSCAALALERKGDPVACTALEPLLEDPVDIVRRSAIQALGRLGCTAARGSVLARLARVVDEEEETALIAALGCIGGTIEEVLRRAIAHPSARVRAAGAAAWASVGSPEALDVLRLRAIGDTQTAVRVQAAKGLGRIGSKEALLTLIDLITGDPDASVRRAAARGLHGASESELLGAQRTGLGDVEAEVRAQIVRNLGASGNLIALPWLLQHATHERSLPVLAESNAAIVRLDPFRFADRAPAPAARPLFDPTSSGAAFTNWLLDPRYFPRSEVLVFYNLGCVEAIDLDDNRKVFDYVIEDSHIRLRDSSEQRGEVTVELSFEQGWVGDIMTGRTRSNMLHLSFDPFFGSAGPVTLTAPSLDRSHLHGER